MDVNERIARALGWTELHWPKANEQWGYVTYFVGYELVGVNPNGWKREVPDYAHSLDACLLVLADLRAKGWRFSLSNRLDGESWCCHGGRTEAFFAGMEQGEADVCNAPSPAAALAECLADALEAEKSPD